MLIVVFLNGIKDFIEDLRRKKSDDQENNKKCLVYNKKIKIFEEKIWEDIKTGDIVKVQSDEEFPADLVLLHSGNPDGNCYIETKNLDGETNLKIKQSEGRLSFMSENEEILCLLKGVLYTKPPNEKIFEFDATMKMIIKGETTLKSFELIDSYRIQSAIGK